MASSPAMAEPERFVTSVHEGVEDQHSHETDGHAEAERSQHRPKIAE